MDSKIYNTRRILKIVSTVRVFANPVCSISVKIFLQGLLLKLVSISLKISFYKTHMDMQSPQFLKAQYVLYYFAFISDCIADPQQMILKFLKSKNTAQQFSILQLIIKKFTTIKQTMGIKMQNLNFKILRILMIKMFLKWYLPQISNLIYRKTMVIM